MKASIIIRTYNEARHLPGLLRCIEPQAAQGLEHEVIVVDSGSTDGTPEVACQFGCRVVQIPKAIFSFGRSLNVGCAAATGDVLVFISGHCVPVNEKWLASLTAPLLNAGVALCYGRQVGNGTSRFSECRIFEKYFPPESRVPQEGYYCNNANAALLRAVWQNNRFDEEITGLEDMHLGKRLVGQGLKIGYVAEAVVYHLHEESWRLICRRFEREAIAMQHIMPEIHVSLWDFIHFAASSIVLDMAQALRQGVVYRHAREILAYRLAQYWGVYRGNHLHRELSRQRKEQYFYPR